MTRILPSGKAECPEQNKSVTLLGTATKVPVPGSQTRAETPESSNTRTWPVRMRTAFIATIGQLIGALQLPTSDNDGPGLTVIVTVAMLESWKESWALYVKLSVPIKAAFGV